MTPPPDSAAPRSPRRASVVLEFALSLPVMIALLSAVTDYGWYLTRQSEVLNCVRAAVRVGIAAADSGGSPTTTAEARARTALTYLGHSLTGATVHAATSTDTTLGETVLTLTVSLPYEAPVGLVPSPPSRGGQFTMLVP